MKKIQILTFSCPDQSGIQAKVTGLMNKHNAFLTDVQSYSDKDSNKFFSRIVFFINDIEIASNDFFIEFESLAIELSMKWSIDDESRKIKTVIAVSKEGHCLNDLLYRAKYRDM
ncbi:formyltetrahydrofolate deformylase, partial [Gammaproteobacteria bacterium]|nr:formyltetrahydrofolate deformylase [Gammaproteobacteria bacterium]